MAAKKKTVKKSTKEAVKKATPKKTAKKAAKKEGLRKPQIRILEFMKRHSKPLTRAEIAEGAPADHAMLNSYLGAHDESVRAKNDKTVMVSLLTLKHVKVEYHDVDGRDTAVYTITASGRAAVAAIKA